MCILNKYDRKRLNNRTLLIEMAKLTLYVGKVENKNILLRINAYVNVSCICIHTYYQYQVNIIAYL